MARIAWSLSSATKYFNALKLCSFCMPKSLPTHKRTTLPALLTFKGCASRWHKCVGGSGWYGWQWWLDGWWVGWLGAVGTEQNRTICRCLATRIVPFSAGRSVKLCMTFRPVATAPVDLCAAVALLNVKYLPVVESAT